MENVLKGSKTPIPDYYPDESKAFNTYFVLPAPLAQNSTKAVMLNSKINIKLREYSNFHNLFRLFLHSVPVFWTS